jgi:hypothetical protein
MRASLVLDAVANRRIISDLSLARPTLSRAGTTPLTCRMVVREASPT